MRHRPERNVSWKNSIQLEIVQTYTEDQDAADNSGVLRRSSLIVDGAQEALLRTGGRVGDGDALGRHGFGECEAAWIDRRCRSDRWKSPGSRSNLRPRTAWRHCVFGPWGSPYIFAARRACDSDSFTASRNRSASALNYLLSSRTLLNRLLRDGTGDLCPSAQSISAGAMTSVDELFKVSATVLSFARQELTSEEIGCCGRFQAQV